MRRFFLRIFFGAFFLLEALFPHAPLHAQKSPGGLTVSPAFQEIVLDQKDEKMDFSVSISNATEVSVTLRVVVFDFGSLDESGGVAFLGASNDLGKKYTLASWMRPEKDVLTIEPDTTEKILVTIENRDTLSPGGHYGALTFRVGDEARADGTGSTIAVNQLFSSLIFVKKVGGDTYNLALKELKYRHNGVNFQETLRLRFQNSGNMHVVPRGMVVVTDPIGRGVAKGIINEESALILPETFRVYPTHLNVLRAILVPGRYTMKIAYRYDGKDEFETKSIQFVLIPLPTILAGLVLIGIGRRYMNKRQKKAADKDIYNGFFQP